MKKTLSMVLAGVIFLFTSSLMAATTLKESAFDALDIKVSGSLIETYYDSFEPTAAETDAIDSENSETIFEVYNATNNGYVEDIDNYNIGATKLEYVQKLASMNKLVRDSEDNIETVTDDLSKYKTTDDSVNKVLEKYLAYQKAVTEYLKCKNAEYSAKILGYEDGATSESLKALTAAALKEAKTAKETFTSSMDAITDTDTKDKALAALKDMHAVLKVSKTKFESSDVIPAKGCDKTKTDDCEAQGKTFLNSLINRGEQPSYGTIYYKPKKSCVLDKIMKTLSTVFNLGQVFCDRQVRKNGMVKADGSPNTGSLACLSAYKHLGNTKDNVVLNPYIDRLDNASVMNLALLTKGAGTNGSVSMGGFSPTNVFGTGTGTAAGTDAGTGTITTSTTTPSSVTDTGDGISRYNASTAAADFYGPSISTYNKMASDASSLVKSVKPTETKISSYNDALSSAMIASDPKTAALPQTEKQWAISTLNATTSTTPSQQTDALRLEFSKQQAQIKAIINQLDVTQRNLGKAKFMALYGSQTESKQALAEVASYSVNLKMLKSQGMYAESRLGLLMGTLGLGGAYQHYNFTYNTFDKQYMYAANGNKGMTRALKLEDIKTPITLKKGWQNDFKAYVEDMAKRSEEAKKNMNQAKVKIRELLAEKLPVISLEKLPQPGEIRDQLINMQSIKKASLKNISIINKAMSYHNSRKNAYSADQYSSFKQEQELINDSMKRTVSSINAAEGPVSDANDIMRSLYSEVPRSEALRMVAKKMVEEGR